MKRIVAAVLICVAMVALTSCVQRESKFQYEKKVRKIYNVREQTTASISSIAYDDAVAFANAQKEIQSAIDDLKKINPPRNVQEAHDLYVLSLEGEVEVLILLGGCAQEQQVDRNAGIECRKGIDSTKLDDIENDFRDAVTIYRHEGYKLPQTAQES